MKQLIHYLIQKWRYDHTTLLIDESRDDFASYFYPSPSPVYGPPNYQNYGPNNVISPSDSYYPEPIYIPKPQYPFQDNGVTYIPPKVTEQNYTNGLNGYQYRKPTYQQHNRGRQLLNYKYSNDIPQTNRPLYSQPYQQDNYYPDIGPQIAQYNNNIWKR
ncbi:hypothetical protein NQ314_003368 [Rhamnusium bicolor]|uniref:Uncharacterized protein n=1 Tax=Rhamnusium bicolor TaxID=1586634 RepID=A0AAV8ZMN4_9CUCU|nr:hypothetical protein NQ314_003368 [Rhamnusium bicolor]